MAHAILSGEASTGVTIMQIVEPPQTGGPRFDHGPILLSSPSVPIPPRATVQSLTAILAQIGARLTLDVLDRLDDHLAAARSQTELLSAVEKRAEMATACSQLQPNTSPAVAHVSPSSAPKLKRERAEINFERQTALEIDCRARALAGRFALCAYIGHTPVKLSSPLAPHLVRQLLPFCIPPAASTSTPSSFASQASTLEIMASCVPTVGPATTPASSPNASSLPAGAVLFSRYPSRSRHRHLPPVPESQHTATASASVVPDVPHGESESTSHAAPVEADVSVAAPDTRAQSEADASEAELDGALLVRCSDGGFVGFGRVQIVAPRGERTRRPLSAREFANGYLRDRRTPLVLASSPAAPLPADCCASVREQSVKDDCTDTRVNTQNRSRSLSN